MGASVFKASAGAGKTYLLVQHYIAFCLQPHHRFDQALAVTFTNKAAGEMKTRILDMLHQLATQTASPAYVKELQSIMGSKKGYTVLSDAQIQYQAAKTRSDILHRYAQFAVGTIDAFFQRILRSFARELELSVNYNLELDQDAVLEEVTDLLLDRLSDDPGLADWLLQFMREKMEDGKSWNLENDLLSFSKELLKPEFQSFAGQHEDLRQTVHQLKSDLLRLVTVFENKMDAIGKEALQVMEQYGLDFTDFSGGANGIGNHFNKIQKNRKEYAPTATVTKVLNGEKGFVKQSLMKSAPHNDAWENGVADKMQEAVDLYETEGIAYNTALLTLRHLNQLGILNDMAQLLKQIRDERDLLLISDTNHLLASLTRETDTPFVYEKVGQQYRFFLLDEFQDTSTQQWLNLIPLLQHALDEQHEVLIVGDIKQSIYRWRGGNMELLREQVHQAFQHYDGYHEVSLDSNWRSLPAIVDFNNAFFNALPTFIKKEVQAIDTDNLLTQLFDDVQQLPKRNDQKQGYVQVDMVPFDKEVDEDESWKEKNLECLPKAIDKVLADGYSGKDICFLVDTNQEGAMLAAFLSEKGYPVISQDSLLLGNSKAVQLIIHTLYWLQDQQEPLFQLQLANSYLQWTGQQETAQHFLQHARRENNMLSGLDHFPESLLQKGAELLQLPLYDLVEHILQQFGMDRSPDAFTTQFLDKVLDYLQDEEAILPAFLAWWEERGHKETLSTTATDDAMQIMTIHKSKGLQFQVVMIPFFQFQFKHKFPPLMWLPTPDKTPYPADLLLPITYKKDSHTYFDIHFRQELLSTVADILNKWYVAFTRAADRLYTWGHSPEKRRPDSASIIEDLFTSQQTIGETVFKACYDESTARFSYGNTAGKQREEQSDEAISVATTSRSPWQTRIPLTASSRSIDSYENLQANTSLQFGRLFHELFARIEQLDDIPFQLQQMQLEGWCKKEEAKELSNEIDKLLSSSTLKDWFNVSWQAFNERDLLLPDGQTKRPDRVIVKDGVARVLDYKTGTPKDEHTEQVKSYAQILQEMGYTVQEASILYTQDLKFQNVPLA